MLQGFDQETYPGRRLTGRQEDEELESPHGQRGEELDERAGLELVAYGRAGRDPHARTCADQTHECPAVVDEDGLSHVDGLGTVTAPKPDASRQIGVDHPALGVEVGGRFDGRGNVGRSEHHVMS